MRSTLRILAVAGVFSFLVTIARGDSEIVIAIRYLQAEGISHSHLYLYREDGKLLCQLTNDNSGQDVAPIFDLNGDTIVFTREKPTKWSSIGRGIQKRREDACALQKLARNRIALDPISHEVLWDCDASSHRFSVTAYVVI